MATTKIATLAIRTLAKPIAAQIKHQAQSHQRFRSICISLAQFMHRTEMALRSNLLASGTADGEKPKVRPLNEAKAVTNGANFLAEGFLFALAAALIIGESYRGSRSRAKQRDRTEEGLDELKLITKTISERVGVDFEDIMQKVRQIELEKSQQEDEGKGEKEEDEEEKRQKEEKMTMLQTIYKQREQMEQERDRLQHAVNVLLRLTLKSGWIQGSEALHLQSILDGTDEHRKERDDKIGEEGEEKSKRTSTSLDNNPSPILTQLSQLQSQFRAY